MRPAQTNTLFPALPLTAAAQSSRPRRICIASFDFVGPVRNGGVGTAFTSLGEALAAAGHDVTLLFLGGRWCENKTIEHWIEYYQKKNIRFVPLPESGLRIESRWYLTRGYEAYLWLQKNPFDIVHFSEWKGPGYFTMRAKQQGLDFANVQMCVHTHGPTLWHKLSNGEYVTQLDDLEVDYLERRSVEMADVVVSPSQYLLRWMLERDWILPPQCFVQQYVRPATARQPLPNANRVHQINELVFFGRLETRKGLVLFCDALDRIKNDPKLKSASLTFLGKVDKIDGRDSGEYLADRAKTWPWKWQIISDRDQAGAMDYLQGRGRLAVLPSLVDNLPNTVLECLGAQVPFLASDTGGIPEMIAAQDLAATCFPLRAQAFAEKLRTGLLQGVRPAAYAVEQQQNEKAWVRWHESLPLADANPSPAAPAFTADTAPLVSICMSHFNRPAYLRQALASIEAQTYPNFEVILIDDGSTDPEAKKLIDSLAAPFARRGWQLLRNPENRYPGAARNRAVQHAKGEYILFMDDDNYAKPHEMSTFVKVALKTGADVVTCCLDTFSGAEPPTPQMAPKTRWLFVGDDWATGALRNNFGDTNGLWRREIFLALGGFHEDWGVGHEDWELLAKAVLQGYRLQVVPDALVWYRLNENEATVNRKTPRQANLMANIRPYLRAVSPPLRHLVLLAQGQLLASVDAGVRIKSLEEAVNRSDANSPYVRATVQWRAKLEAGRVLASMDLREAAVKTMIEAVKLAEATKADQVVLEAVTEIGAALRPLDAGRAAYLLDLAAQLAKVVRKPAEMAKIARLKAGLTPPEAAPAAPVIKKETPIALQVEAPALELSAPVETPAVSLPSLGIEPSHSTTTVVHVIQQLSLGGGTRTLAAVSKFSSQTGPFRHQIISLMPSAPEAIALAQAAGLPVLDAPDKPRLLRELAQADLVQVEWWNSPEMQAFLHGPLPPMRLLVWYHVCGDHAPQLITPALANFADLNVATNPWTASQLPAFRNLSPAADGSARVGMAIPGADFERLAGLQRRAHAGFNIGYIGSVDFVKMHRRFVLMSAAVRVPEARFVVCGAGSALATLRAEAEQLNAAPRFDFRGYVSDIKSVIETLDVYGYPLCADTYASGELNLQEVMLAGVPVVVFPHGGVRGLVQHERTGLIVQNETEYRDALEHLFHHPEARLRLGEAARAYALENFGAQNGARAMNPLYEQLLRQPKRERSWPGSAAANLDGASLLAENLGELATPFLTSLTATDTDALLAAETAIAQSSILVSSPFSGGILNYRSAYPKNGHLHLWSGLVLREQGKLAPAIGEFGAALENGLRHWRVYWYIAQTAARHGDQALAKNMLAKVLETQPDFAPARALQAELGLEPALTPVQISLSETEPLSLSPAAPAAESEPLVTAIVSAYNSEKFLRGCLEDLLQQTIADRLEIVVVDTASPQNERAIVEEFQARFPRLVYLRTEARETVYGAWNRGVKAARGKYLTNANTDDRHRSDAFEILARTLDQNPSVSLVYGDCVVTRTENATFADARPVNVFKWLDFNRHALVEKGCFVGPQPMWRRDVHAEHGYFDAALVSAGDYEFWLRLAQTREFLHVPELLGLYLESPASVEHANGDRAVKEALAARARYQQLLKLPATGPAKSLVPAASAPAKSVTERPAVAALGNVHAARALFQKKDFPAAWSATTDAIELRPFHPEAYLLLGEIALAAGDSVAARRCAQAALDLAPELRAAKKFLKGNLRGNAKHDWLKLPAALTAPKGSARKLSVCFIARNEEKFLGQALQSVRAVAHQIVVVDTGSTDRTVEIARAHGAEVHAFAWCDDFSAARNAALAHARGEWILFLDADEELSEAGRQTLLKEIQAASVMAYRLPIADAGREAEGCHYVPRLFRNAPGIFFSGRIHEHPFGSVEALCQAWGLDNKLGKTLLLHHGYTQEVTRARGKVARNLQLLELSLQEQPQDANLRMNYGLELVRSERLAEGLEQYREALCLVAAAKPGQISPEMRETLLLQLSTHLLRAKRYDEVLSVLTGPVARSAELCASLHFTLGLALSELGRHAEAAAHLGQCIAQRHQPALTPIDPAIRTVAPRHCLACCLAKGADAQKASEAFQAALEEDPKSRAVRFDYAAFLLRNEAPVEALKQLFALVDALPDDQQAWEFGGEIVLSNPGFLEVAEDWTTQATERFPAAAPLGLHRAEVLLLTERCAPALALWQKFGEPNQPRHTAAQMLCAIVAGQSPLRPPAVAEPAVSREFLGWYKRLLQYGAASVLTTCNQNLDTLADVLPTAAQWLASAIAEADTKSAPPNATLAGAR